MVTTIVKNYRQSPRKVRLVADLVRGKKVDKALTSLNFLTKKASEPVKNAIENAIANAKHNFNIEADRLFIKEIRVDEGTTLMRRMPRARGTAYPIKKRSSHISIVLDTKDTSPKAQIATASKKEVKVEEDHKEEAI